METFPHPCPSLPQTYGNRIHHPALYIFPEVGEIFTECWWRCLTGKQSLSHGNEEMCKHTGNMTMCLSRWHQSPLTTDSRQHCRKWTIQGNRALALLCNSTLLFPEPSRRKQKVNPRQPKTHEITQLPITKHNSRTWPAQQVSQVFLARYLSFQQRCCRFFQKCCLLKQTGQIVVEMLRKCQSAKCQKDFD